MIDRGLPRLLFGLAALAGIGAVVGFAVGLLHGPPPAPGVRDLRHPPERGA